MAITGILVPLDGAGIATSVLPHVAALARPLHAAVHLLAIIDPHTRERPGLYYTLTASDEADDNEKAPLVPAGRLVSQQERARRVERARLYLNALASRLQSFGIETSYESTVGDPAQDIVRLARRRRFSVIALTPHSRYAIGRGLGSITDAVLHSSSVPIFVAPQLSEDSPGADSLVIRTVVVALDGSRMAETALDPAREIAAAAEAELVLLHAIGGSVRSDAWESGADRVGRDIFADRERAANTYIAGAAERARIPSTPVVAPGDEYDEILAAIRERPGAILVMATEGTSGLTRWQLGSFTDRILKNATAPVLVIPPILAR